MGPTGPIGPRGLTWRGSWSAGTAYAVDDAVTHQGSSYRRLLAGTTGADPGSDATNWALIAQKGDSAVLLGGATLIPPSFTLSTTPSIYFPPDDGTPPDEVFVAKEDAVCLVAAELSVERGGPVLLDGHVEIRSAWEKVGSLPVTGTRPAYALLGDQQFGSASRTYTVRVFKGSSYRFGMHIDSDISGGSAFPTISYLCA